LRAGLLAAAWLLGLLAAAPALRTSEPYGFADRLRDALTLGVAIPLVLGFADLLYPVACWIALATLLAIALQRSARHPSPEAVPSRDSGVPYVLVGALAIVAWPALVRPLLDGDSLSYHLPNAASWVQAHGVWTGVTRYWWYPPASEMFAAGLYATAGPFALGWSGLGAIALLGLRIFTWAQEMFEAPSWLADALAAATVTALPLALQSGSLQNDVWLAAFFLESLWSIRRDDGAAMRSIAVTALLKPYGWIFAALAAIARRARPAIWSCGACTIVLWAIRTALLRQRAIVPVTATWFPQTWQTSIAAHGIPALLLLVRTLLALSPFMLAALLAALLGPGYERRDRGLGFAGFAALLFFYAMPFAYATSVPQLATGASLRQAAPAVALGALLLLRPAMRLPPFAAGLFLGSAVIGAGDMLALYWADAPTRSAVAVAALAVGLTALAARRRTPLPLVAGFIVAAAVAAWLAASNPVPFYADALQIGGQRSGLYAWIHRTRPQAVGGNALRLGTVNVLSPGTRTVDLPDDGTCAAASAQRVLLVAVAQNGPSTVPNAARLNAARACGRVLYDDGLAVVVRPASR
jgi:hypothetical protein